MKYFIIIFGLLAVACLAISFWIAFPFRPIGMVFLMAESILNLISIKRNKKVASDK